MRKLYIKGLGFIMLTLALNLNAEIAIVANEDFNLKLEETIVKDLFLGKWVSIDGTTIRPVVSEEEDVLRIYAGKALNLSLSQMRIKWSTFRFTGKGDKPIVTLDSKEVISMIKENRNYIGIVHELDVTDDVKVLFRY